MGARNRLLREWARYLHRAASHGTLTGKPLTLGRVEGIAGPRAGALEVYAGLDAGKLLKALMAHDAAVLRQFIPWAFIGEPVAYMAGRYVRLEAGWPDHLARTMIRLGDLGANPRQGGWIAGQNERGETIAPRLDDKTPHFLVSGATGSGKSVALKNAVLQLSRDPQNRLVLVDGKFGESLNLVARLRGVVGPVAVDGPTVRAALGWACAEMRRRYEAGAESCASAQGHRDGRLVVVFDEFQELAGDPVVVDLLRKLAAQGRGARVHLLAATQHPTVEAFGDTSTRRNLTGKIALRVADPDASRVAVGGRLPRADFLLGAGDLYAVRPGAIHRVQGAYVDGREIGRAERGEWTFETWPEYDAGSVGQDLPTDEVNWSYTGAELAVSIVSAGEGEGRPAMVKRLEAADLGTPGSVRAARLLKLGREAHDWLGNNGYHVGHCLPA